ncbi:MAG: hypothetical protein U1F33_02195 [Alphaproteobacteria bacterium]
MVLAFVFKRSSVRAGRGDGHSPVRPRLGRLFGGLAVHPEPVPVRAASRIEDYDLNDVGLVRGAVPHAVWEWRRRRLTH